MSGMLLCEKSKALQRGYVYIRVCQSFKRTLASTNNMFLRIQIITDLFYKPKPEETVLSNNGTDILLYVYLDYLYNNLITTLKIVTGVHPYRITDIIHTRTLAHTRTHTLIYS